jgi:hypothetical protein
MLYKYTTNLVYIFSVVFEKRMEQYVNYRVCLHNTHKLNVYIPIHAEVICHACRLPHPLVLGLFGTTQNV